MIDHLGIDTSARERIVINLVPFVQPTNITVPRSIHLSLPVEIQEMRVDQVLDLRRPAALDSLFRTVPNLHIHSQRRGREATLLSVPKKNFRRPRSFSRR